MWARLQLGAGMFYGSSAVLSVVSALRGRRATWRWNELMGPSTMRGLGVLDTVAAKPVPRRGAQRRERASKRRKFMPKTACSGWGGPKRLVAKSLWCKTRPKLPKSLSRPARHYLLKKSDVEHPLFKRSAHTQGPPACAASFPGPSREKRRRRCILAVATEGDSTPLRSEIKL